ncbi:uncharacterized protein LOC131695435 [Topomyia yanbarensis]|uniref:uncharacterized protein LOC131695435 n=1 Tax=Topomyia yanbarensis TaxID=2498891 RepID=UPI00273AF44C|nr:uncharacterized protein LOC131695435 [Topomyia yanbarensis]
MAELCSVPECPGNIALDDSLAFYHFPRNPKRIKDWCAKLGLPSTQRDHDWSAKCVCSRHFSPEQYVSRGRLKPDAVPDCHVPVIKQESERQKNCKDTVDALKDKRPNEEEISIKDTFVADDNFAFCPPLVAIDSLDMICRLCLTRDAEGTFETIFTNDFVHCVLQATGLEIQQDHGYPYKVCQTCTEKITYINRSREWFHKNDKFLRTLIEEHTLVENNNIGKTQQEDNSDASCLIVPESSGTCPTPTETVFIKEENGLASEIDVHNSSPIEAEEVTPDQLGVQWVEDGGVDVTGCNNTTEIIPRKIPKKRDKTSDNHGKFNCNTCFREFDSLVTLRRHASHHRSFYPCRECGVSYFNPKTLGLHIEKYHSTQTDDALTWKKQDEYDLIKEMSEAFNGTRKK